MGDKTKIQWCDASVNAWWGCARVHPGCLHCYAERQAGRFGVEWGRKVPRRYIPSWRKTLAKVAARAKKEGRKLRVFINDMSDLFDNHDGDVVDAAGRLLWIHPDTDLISESVGHLSPGSVRPLKLADLRRQVFGEMDRYADCLNFILLTKRPQNIPKQWCGVSHPDDLGGDVVTMTEFRPNVAILYSASDQKTLESGLSDLVRCRRFSPVLGLSLEPLVGAIKDPFAVLLGRCGETIAGQDVAHWLQWVIIGGESGPGARPCPWHTWIRPLVQDLRKSQVPVFVKQFGSHTARGLEWPDTKGGDMSEWPEDLRVREYPEGW